MLYQLLLNKLKIKCLKNIRLTFEINKKHVITYLLFEILERTDKIHDSTLNSTGTYGCLSQIRVSRFI